MKKFRIKRSFVLLFVAFILGITGCSSVENLPRQVLLSSSEVLMIEEREITVSADLTRDFSQDSPEDGSPLTARIEIVASNGQNLPDGLDTDAVWVMVDDQVWSSSYSGEQLENDKTRIVKIAREGPKFSVGKKAEVIVRIHHNNSTYLLRASGQVIERTS